MSADLIIRSTAVGACCGPCTIQQKFIFDSSSFFPLLLNDRLGLSDIFLKGMFYKTVG